MRRADRLVATTLLVAGLLASPAWIRADGEPAAGAGGTAIDPAPAAVASLRVVAQAAVPDRMAAGGLVLAGWSEIDADQP